MSYFEGRIANTNNRGKEFFLSVRSFTNPKAEIKVAAPSADWARQVACSLHDKIKAIQQSFSSEM